MGLFSSSNRDNRVVIAGGGTGGHLFPGVAVVEAIKELDPTVDIAFVGTEKGIEARVVPELGYNLELVDVPTLKGGGLTGWASGLSKLPFSGLASMSTFKKLNPGLVISVGGYAAGPFTMLSSVRGVPTALMEQNSVPGMTNKLLGRVVDRAFLTFESSAKFFDGVRCDVVGNPVRRDLLELAEVFTYEAPEEGEPFNILVIGGSGGAASLNGDLPAALVGLEELGSHVRVRHQCGRGRQDELAGRYDGFRGEVEVTEFIDDMAAAYDWCDLLICRAGASTIAEVLVLGIPAVYVPFPGAADDHQTKNAREIAEAGAGVTIPDDEIGSARATRLLAGLIRNPVSLENLSRKARSMGRPNAARCVAEACLDMLDS
jgi:UDP-N-acetylglucosamine--N-acetylmuramyl-(pentapeptide) pyrophosphoryl-undecaprenol N-acetylglucosamine transferase